MRRTPLVCQHLENVSREVLSEYRDIVQRYIRWVFWRYERAPDDWALLDELRK